MKVAVHSFHRHLEILVLCSRFGLRFLALEMYFCKDEAGFHSDVFTFIFRIHVNNQVKNLQKENENPVKCLSQ